MTTRRRFIGSLATATTLPAVWPAAAQDAPPIKQLTVVVGFPAGGGTDTVARLIGEALRGSYAETVIVENRAGAGGRIGADYVKGRPANGATLLFTPAFPMVIYPHVYRKMPYDTLKDFTPVAITHRGLVALAVGPAVPASVKTVRDFVAWAKAHPNDSTFGAPPGSTQHFAGAQFGKSAGIEFRLINYKGGAPAIVDCLGGHIAAVVAPLSEVAPMMADGRLRALAATGAKRTAAMPDVPTMIEAGYPDVLFQDWSGFLGPAGLPADLVARANGAINKALQSPKIAEAMLKLGSPPDTLTPPEFAREVLTGWEKYERIVKATGFVAEE